jgi:hypothetical protein
MSRAASILSGILLGLSPAAALASDRPVVVELFTSQGCSSCPPANAFLNEMTKGRSDVLPLAFHVTYWDRLGWKDPFSITDATLRQDRYGHRFGDGSYTPEMVVDGSVGLVGSDRDEVNAAIERAKRSQATVADLKITRTGDNLSIKIGAGTGSGKLLLVGFDPEHTTKINRGENGGRTFFETNVVRSIRAIGDWSGSARAFEERAPEGQDMAVIVEAPDGRIIGAARLSAGST